MTKSITGKNHPSLMPAISGRCEHLKPKRHVMTWMCGIGAFGEARMRNDILRNAVHPNDLLLTATVSSPTRRECAAWTWPATCGGYG